MKVYKIKQIKLIFGIVILNVTFLFAQEIPSPVIIGIGSAWANISVSFTQISVAEYYIIEIAHDSLFSINKYSSFIKLGTLTHNNGIINYIGLQAYPYKLYYCRIRAANRTGVSKYSAVKSTWCSGNPPFVQLDSISQTSVTIRWSYFNVWYTSPPIPQLNLDTVPYRIILTNNDKKTIADTVVRRKYGIPTGITFNKLTSNTKYGIKVVCLDEWGESGYTVNFRTSYSKLKGKDRQPIFFNEHPLARSAPWEDTSLYYSYGTRAFEPNTFTSEDADIILSRMLADGIPIDTAWFHDTDKIWWTKPSDNAVNPPAPTGPAELIIKLRKTDDRVKAFGFYNRNGRFDSYSTSTVYYRYILDDRATSVEQEPVEHGKGEIIPNPVENEYVVRYKVENTAEVELRIVDALGREWSLQAPQQSVAGVHEYRGNSRGLAAGAYTIRVIQRFRGGGMAVTPLKLYVMK